MATNLNPTAIIPKRSASASEWILWHKSLKSRYGKATANTLWIEAWNARGKSTSVLTSSSPANTTELRRYLESQDITIDQGTFDYVADIWDETTGLMAMVSKAGTYGGALLLLLVIIPVFIFLLNVARKPELIGQTVKDLGQLKKLTV